MAGLGKFLKLLPVPNILILENGGPGSPVQVPTWPGSQNLDLQSVPGYRSQIFEDWCGLAVLYCRSSPSLCTGVSRKGLFLTCSYLLNVKGARARYGRRSTSANTSRIIPVLPDAIPSFLAHVTMCDAYPSVQVG